MSLTLRFLGGAGTVTGSKFLLQRNKDRILVDCGLFQGFKNLRLRNWEPFPVAPGSIEAVVLSHAHIDHSGYLPLLIRQGFKGPVYATPATIDLCRILLTDCGHLQERDAEFANRRGFSRHKPALPLYTEEDAEIALKALKPLDFGETLKLPGGGTVRMLYAGHILGAASPLIEWDGKRIAFSGDIGRFDDPLLFDPQPPERADYLVMESTYGGRRHEAVAPEDALAPIVSETIKRGGTVLVPAFAVGRAQRLLFHIGNLKKAGRIPGDLPVYLDSPMAIDATEITLDHGAQQRLTPQALRDLGREAHPVRKGEDSQRLSNDPTPKIIISASGMATGGRILHHLEHYAPEAKNSILFTGFQAGGTRGAAMVAGTDTIKMHGRHIPVRAAVHDLPMMSAHADSGELLRWAKGFKTAPKEVFIVHGEPSGADALRQSLEERLGWRCTVPDQGQSVTLP